MLLTQLQVPFERRELSVTDRSDRAEVLGGLNPALRVPTLVLDDGRPLGEKNWILCFLARGTALLPDDRYEHAQVLQWLFFEQYSHEPNIAVARFRSHAGIDVDADEHEARQRGGVALWARWNAIFKMSNSSSPAATPSPTSRSTPTRT